MKNTWKKSTYLASAALLGMVAMSGTTAMADVTVQVTATVTSSVTEVVTTEMSFGSIELIPAGDTILIAAGGVALSGDGGAAATPASAATSVVTGGTSALITIASPIGFDVDIIYEVSIVLTDGTTSATMSLIDDNSGGGTANTTVTHAAGVDTLIHVGGSLALPAGATTGAYTGSTAVTINYT